MRDISGQRASAAIRFQSSAHSCAFRCQNRWLSRLCGLAAPLTRASAMSDFLTRMPNDARRQADAQPHVGLVNHFLSGLPSQCSRCACDFFRMCRDASGNQLTCSPPNSVASRNHLWSWQRQRRDERRAARELSMFRRFNHRPFPMRLRSSTQSFVWATLVTNSRRRGFTLDGEAIRLRSRRLAWHGRARPNGAAPTQSQRVTV